jgi:hypothetical protein
MAGASIVAAAIAFRQPCGPSRNRTAGNQAEGSADLPATRRGAQSAAH